LFGIAFYLHLSVLMFSNYFNILILKINFKKILLKIYFATTPKHQENKKEHNGITFLPVFEYFNIF